MEIFWNVDVDWLVLPFFNVLSMDCFLLFLPLICHDLENECQGGHLYIFKDHAIGKEFMYWLYITHLYFFTGYGD